MKDQVTTTPRALLDERLMAAAGLVRQGAYFADIGTDHAYLPVFLLEEGRIKAAYASDINDGPIKNAAACIAAHELSEHVILRTADGLQGLFDAFPAVTDIAICGMGGELVAKLLADEPKTRDTRLHFILQPMSRPAALRRFLAENGFHIQKEVISREKGRIYTCLSVIFTGTPESISTLEAEIGKPPSPEERTPLYFDYIQARIKTEEEIRDGKRRGRQSTEAEDTLIEALRARLPK